MKKFFIIMFIIIFVFPLEFAFADEEVVEEDENIPELVQAVSNDAEEPNINSRAAIVYDRNSKEVIFGKEENTRRKMASTTKIMTAIIVIENSNISDVVEVSKKAAATGGSRLGLKAGDKLTVNDLLHGLMMVSGNDAAVALAEHVGGSVEGFADKMNNKAKELGLVNTNFVTPHGLDNDEHYTTAYELAQIADYALNNKTFLELVGTKNYTVNISGRQRNLSNTNELLGNLAGVYGVKTGFTNGANRCLVTSTKRDNLDIITVVLGADTKKNRTQDSIKLIEYSMNNFIDVNIEETVKKEFEKWKNNSENNICVRKGKEQSIDSRLTSLEKKYITVKKNKEQDIKISIQTVKEVEAPVKENDIMGVLSIRVDNEEKLVINVNSKKKVEKKGISNYFSFFVDNYTKILEKSTV